MACFESFGVIMFFRKDPPQTEGRRDADPGVKLPIRGDVNENVQNVHTLVTP